MTAHPRACLLAALTLAAAAPLAAAPAPLPGQLRPGAWVLVWGGTPAGTGPLLLHGRGTMRWTPPGLDWSGSWRWDPATRTLAVAECEARSLTRVAWRAVLDHEFRGQAECGGVRTDIHIYRPGRAEGATP